MASHMLVLHAIITYHITCLHDIDMEVDRRADIFWVFTPSVRPDEAKLNYSKVIEPGKRVLQVCLGH